MVINEETEVYKFLIDLLEDETKKTSGVLRGTLEKIRILLEQGCMEMTVIEDDAVQDVQDNQKKKKGGNDLKKKEEQKNIAKEKEKLAENSTLIAKKVLLQNLALVCLPFEDIMKRIAKNEAMRKVWISYLVPYDPVTNTYTNKVSQIMRISQDFRDKIKAVFSSGVFRKSKEYFVIFPEDFEEAKNLDGDNMKLALSYIKHDWRLFWKYPIEKVQSNKEIVLALVQ